MSQLSTVPTPTREHPPPSFATKYTPSPFDEWRQYNVILDPELHRRCKAVAAFYEITLTQVFVEALSTWLGTQDWPTELPQARTRQTA